MTTLQDTIQALNTISWPGAVVAVVGIVAATIVAVVLIKHFFES